MSVIWLARVFLVMGGSCIFFVVMLCRSSGVPLLIRVWEHPESQNTLVFFFLPRVLLEKKGGGSVGVCCFSPSTKFVECGPVGGTSPLFSLSDETSTTLGLL